MAEKVSLKCPVCQARFRSVTLCSRCGADLTMLMKTAAKAFLLRQAAREAAHRGELKSFLRLLSQAAREKKDNGHV